MMRPIPFSLLMPDRKAPDRKTYVAEAHRIRSAVVADLIRDFLRWVSTASR
jgi:hypothetical protein